MRGRARFTFRVMLLSDKLREYEIQGEASQTDQNSLPALTLELAFARVHVLLYIEEYVISGLTKFNRNTSSP